MTKFVKNLLIAFLIFVIISGLFSLYSSSIEKPVDISLSQLVDQINNEEVAKIEVKDNKLIIELKDGIKEESLKETESSLSETFINLNVEENKLNDIEILIGDTSGANFLFNIIIPFLLPVILIGFILWFMLRQAQRGNTQAISFGNSKARVIMPGEGNGKTTFNDVAGVVEAKEELEEVVDFLKNPKKFLDLGAKIPKGVLLVGSPGTGKTLLAKAVAGEANVPFFNISGSEFVEMFVGVGASRVRDLFKNAKKHAPAIIFVDEIDAVGRQRGTGLGGGHDEREQTLNQVLVEMDGFDTNTNVIVMAATNRPDVLDPALLRPGRFDRRVMLDVPGIKDREAILKIHAKNKPMADDVDFKKIAERTPGFAGADLANIENEAAILAARNSRKKITQMDLANSIEKVMMGPEKKSQIFSEKEKKITAYHEAGHALTAHLLPNADPIHKISIISRGRAAGYTLKLPLTDKHFYSKSDFLDELTVLLAGYVAENIIFNDITTGAQNDLKRASEIAKNLIVRYGMSKLGPISFSDHDEWVFLGKELGEQRGYSERIASEIDQEIKNFVVNAQKRAEELLESNKDLLIKIAERLIENEVIEQEEFEQLVGTN
ncbi:ATP-dependent metallopeptidase FtsH/Yme1/Tma family protein [bacterium]|nr:MAG: ATP-dependent metallopeptidase FtsH/Yme1/Tma family protein [bacterium]